jgi:hypothetical protein
MNNVEKLPYKNTTPMEHQGEIYLGNSNGTEFYIAVETLGAGLTIRFEHRGERNDIHINRRTLRGLHHAYEVLYEFDRSWD